MTKKVYVAFGSQTGNAESIAKELADSLSSLTSVECTPLNKLKGLKLPEICTFFIVVCSTTGNGDAPENADSWWRSIKLRSAPKDLFLDLEYSVLGLGDTNYDKFCHMGKSIDKRLTELGGKRKIPLYCADEATNLEETVEQWKTATIQEVRNRIICSSASINELCGVMDKGCALNRVPSFAVPMERMLSEREDDPLFLLSNRIPEGLLTLEEVADIANTRSGYETTLQTFVVPAAKTANESVAVVILSPVDANDSKEKGLPPPPPPPQEPHAFHQFRTSPSTNSGAGRSGRSPRETNPHLPCYEHPFSAHITSACWLTSPSLSQETISEGFHGDVSNWGKTKRVVGCTVSIDRSGITYNPGDSIGICCPNLPYAVDIVFRRLQLSHPEISLRSCVRLESADNDRSKEEIMTVDELLSFKFDLMGMPKKTTISHLSFCCQNELERKKMSLLSGKDKLSRLLWTHFVENQGLGVAEILGFFPSCRPTLQQLVNMLTPMPPRYYSIASSPMNSPSSVSFAFSLVRNLMSVQGGTTSSSILSPASSEKAGESALEAPKMIRRVGVCTSFLEYLLAPYLYPSHPIYGFRKQESLQIRIFHKPTLTFHLPGSVSHPLILIGPGTGVAPFISFLEHRMEIAKERQKNKGGELISSGVWRGGFELEGDVCEGNQVNTFICSVKPGPIYLFYGCRDQHDYLFQDKLQHFSKHKILTDFSVAFSRLPGKGKEYVTHKLVEKKKEIAQLIVEEQASVYICGDGNQMAKDVQTVLREMLTELYPEKVGDINQYMTDLRTRRRLLLDIWS